MTARTFLDGRVTLHAGDCLATLATLPAASVDAVITDPPYCSGGVTEAGRGRATHQGLRSETIRSGRFNWFTGDNMTTAGLVWLLRSVACEAVRILKPSGHLLVFADWRMVSMLAPALESAGLRHRNILCWDKGHFGAGTGFRPQHETIIHLTHRAPVFHAADVGNVLRVKRVRASDRLHPTQKPVDLLSDLVRVTSPEDGVVVDPFAGSGALGEAAARLNRRAILVERDPEYLETIARRFSGAFSARPAENGQSLFAGEAAE